jgi:hypothetical protein
MSTTMSNKPVSDKTVNMGFDEIRLYPGAVMQIQAADEGLSARREVKLIGFIKDKCLLVTLPFKDFLQPGKAFVLRGFNGIHAFAFTSQVIRAHTNPFPYVHFTWPKEVGCQLVRKSLRVAIALKARVVLADDSAVAVTMLDMSASGSMLDSPSELGKVGDHASIAFTVSLEGATSMLEFSVVICNVQKKTEGTGFHIGIGFDNIAQNEAMILHYFISSVALKANV